MKRIKQLTALSLITSIILTSASAFATNPDIVYEYNNADITLPNALPNIHINAEDIYNKTAAASDTDMTERVIWEEYDGSIKLDLPQTSSVELPQNRYSIDGVSNAYITSQNVSAQNERTAIPAYYSQNVKDINSSDSFALQNQTGRTGFTGDTFTAEYIDEMTGNLTVTETDLILPGVDGLDLNLSRYYSLTQAELYTKSAELCTTPKTYTLPAGMYVVEETILNTETNTTATYSYAYASEEAAEQREAEIISRDTRDGLYFYTATTRMSQEGELITFDYYYNSDITSASYTTMRSYLGAGWSWSFPSVQVIKENYNDVTEIPSAMYYHNGKGTVMEVKYDELNGCSFTNYVGQDISFELMGVYDSSISGTARIDYAVEDSDCTTYYFGPHGELRSIIDIHGNKIEFSYTSKDFYGAEDMPVISGITDTVGRQIAFSYTMDKDYEYVNVTVTSPFETERAINLTYAKKPVDITFGGELISTEEFLESVTYPNGDTIVYYPATIGGQTLYVRPVEFTFADKGFMSDYVVNTGGYKYTFMYLLGGIVKPTTNSYYNYELSERNLGHSGVCQTYRVTERGDNMSVLNASDEPIFTYSSNVTTYSYVDDYTGYPDYNSIESIPENTYVCRTIVRNENSSHYNDYYKKDGAVLKKDRTSVYDNPVGNSLSVTSSVQSFVEKTPCEVRLTYSNNSGYMYDSYCYNEINTYYNKAFGRVVLETEEMDYNTFLTGDREKQGMSYVYDTDTGFIRSKSWYQTDSKKCTEIYTYTDDWYPASYKAPDDSVTTYTYEFTNGKISKKITTTENDTGAMVITESYTADTAYAFPSTVTKRVTGGTGTTTETTSYTYDMFYGVVKSMTDNNGNTTYYEYDELGRQTRVIYPVYLTYSGYGTKDIKILPVEAISYTNVKRTYGSKLLSTQLLIAQEVCNTVKYYDVSDVEITAPDTLDTTSLDDIFIVETVNYYLGTGELIESNVLDLVGSEGVFKTTTYYYDSDANTVTAVDSKGDSSTVYYDGLGRNVKRTDEFGNHQITEYNLTGDNSGFKSLSYFVPAADETAKQNVVGHTYDRLSRLTSEKAYLQYPDIFVQTTYAYDKVGNVIGITDANNNLNEDGYTQTNTYDKLNRIISSKNANDEIISNTYDSLGNIKKQTITDSQGNVSVLYQRSYDGEGKMISDTDNVGNSNLYTYDNMGRLYASQDKSLKQNGYGYNELGETDSVRSLISEYSITSAHMSHRTPYGANEIYNFKGTYNDSSNNYSGYINETAEYLYSPAGSLLEQVSTFAASTGISGIKFKPTSRYIYDLTGNVTSVVHGVTDDVNKVLWASVTHYDYDKSRLTKVQLNGAETKDTSDSVNAVYEYYDDGKLKSVAYPALSDGTTLKSVYVYDGLSRLTGLTNYKGAEILSGYEYTYDSNGNILSATETVGTAQNTVTYTYDKLNRITSVAGTKGADSYYEYDARGNRKTSFEQIDFLSEETQIFIYDDADKLIRAQSGDDITQLDYSVNGCRYVKYENSDYPEFYVYDASGRLQTIASPVNATGSGGTSFTTLYPAVQYIWGPDKVLKKIDKLSGKSYYYLYNGHGDVAQIVDTSGNVVNSYDYDVWGNFLKKEETIANHFTYFGQTYDETTGLYYLRARYYDPTTGRFTQQDSAEDGYNWYVYGNQNPVMYVDPSGLSPDERLGEGIWSFKHDKFGVSILSHWLFGGGTEYVQENGVWGSYMKDNSFLKIKVQEIVLPLANDVKNSSSKNVDITTSMEIQNGEDIIGYQYLHGTNADVGGFQIKGIVSKNKKGDVTYDLTYTWNDRIDPNFMYYSDSKKAEFAKSIPLANPTDYTIRITWSDKTVIKAKPTWYNWNTGWLK